MKKKLFFLDESFKIYEWPKNKKVIRLTIVYQLKVQLLSINITNTMDLFNLTNKSIEISVQMLND